MALRGLSSYQMGHGDHQGALASLTEALRLIDELGTTEGVAQLMAQCARQPAELGDYDGARSDLRRSLELSEETGSPAGKRSR